MALRGYLFCLCALPGTLAAPLTMAYDEPDYAVVTEYERFEVRRYEPFVIAEVEVRAPFAEAGSKAFRTLFRYIAGANRANSKIQMTTPVLQQPGEQVAMTTPVIQRTGTDAESHRVSFVLPFQYDLDSAPIPTNPDVSLRRVDGRVVAARRYSGTWSAQRYRRHESALLEALEAAGYTPAAAPEWARYNGPMTPWFMRRNEVLVEIADAERQAANE